MKKMISALLAVSALAVAVPAAAQDYGRGGYDRGGWDHGDRGGWDRGGYGENLRETYDRLERRIERNYRMGMLSRREAAVLSYQLRDLRRLDRQYRYNDGRLNRWEREDLMRRADRLEARLRYERRDRDGRPY